MSPKGIPLDTTPDPWIPVCDRCGQRHITQEGHQACTGHISSGERKGQPCSKDPLAGQGVCRSHGGAAAQNRAKGAERVAEAKAELVLRRSLAEAYGDQVPAIDPAEAMLRAVSWKHAEVLALRARVAELDETAMVWGVTREKTGGDDRGTTEEAKPNIWLAMLHAAEDQLVNFAKACRQAGVDERRVQLAEAQAGVVVDVIRRILDGLYQALIAAGITVDILQQAWATAVADIVPRELRAAALGQEA